MVNGHENDITSLSQYDEPMRNILDPVYRSGHFPIPLLAHIRGLKGPKLGKAVTDMEAAAYSIT